MVVGDVGLHFQRVACDVARNACRGLAAALVSGPRLHVAAGKKERIAQGDFPFSADEVSGLHVESPACVDPCMRLVVEDGRGADPAHEVGAERESPVFQQKIGVPAPETAACAVGQDVAVLAVCTHGLVVVGIGSGQQDPDLFLVCQIAL